IDTRRLTGRLRAHGALRGVVSADAALSDAELVQRAKACPDMEGRDMVSTVAPAEPIDWSQGLGEWAVPGQPSSDGKTYRVVGIDCGAKHHIWRHLVSQGFELTAVPPSTPAEAILERRPDGVFVSNGPGDPAAVPDVAETLRTLMGKTPVFGICLGHQLLSRALGAKTFKLKFGHHGANHPVQNLGTEKVEITSQNHGFAVDRDSLEQAGAEATHLNLNDRTVEGFRHKELPVFAVQYHPEASPGPHDSAYLFDCFRAMVETGQAPTTEAMDRAQRSRLAVGAG
ncbi:MAG: glutamine-hydrolyzing carbamoyl-phosphate synthase small subunit, partial [Planctomycetota bacterium]